MLESCDCFLNFSVDFNIAGGPFSEIKWEMSQQMQKDVKKKKNWLTSCWT